MTEPARLLRLLTRSVLIALAPPLSGATPYPPEPAPKDPVALKQWEEQYRRAVLDEQADIQRQMDELQRKAQAAVVNPPPASPPRRGKGANPESPVPPRNEEEIRRVPAQPPAFNTLGTEAGRIARALQARLNGDDLDDAKPFLTRYAGNANALANAAALAWVEKSPGAALLLAAEAVRARPADENAINTLGALLCQAGYAAQGIPILQSLATKLPDDPTVLNNLGQAWLSIGEVEKAKALLLLCVRRAPAHGAAHGGLGAISQAAGDTAGANAHFQAAVASNYSPAAGAALSRRNIRYRPPPSLDRLVVTRDYFNPNHYVPPRPQWRTEQYKTKIRERETFDRYLETQIRQLDARKRESDQTLQQAPGKGLFSARPRSGLLAGLAMRRMEAEAADSLPFIERQLQIYHADIGELKTIRDRRIKTLADDFEQNHGKIFGEGMSVATAEAYKRLCPSQQDVVNDYLKACADRYGLLESMVLPRMRALTNLQLAYLPLTMQGAAYQGQFAFLAAHHLRDVIRLNHATVTDNFSCGPLAEAGAAANPSGALPAPDYCPIKLKQDVFVGDISVDCSGVAISFEAGLAFNAKKNFRSGETTLTAGLGAEFGVAGGSEQMILVWDRNENLSFVGVQVAAEATVSGIPGLSRSEDLGDGLKMIAATPDILPDAASANVKMKLGVTLGPDGPTPTVSGSGAAEVLGRQLFEARL